jgi:hypothetical protein
MISLSFFLILWIILLAIYAFLALISVAQMIRFGVASSMTYFSTGIFLTVAAVVIIATIGYLFTVDWSIGFDLQSILQPPGISL